MAPYTPPPIVAEVQKRWEESKKHHDAFVRRYERNERSYRGLLDSPNTSQKWRHRLHPPYAFNLIETIVSNTTEMGLGFNVHPAPRAGLTMQDAQKLLAQTDVVDDLIRHEQRYDQMDFKQRPLFLSAAIGGIGIGKCGWNYVEGVANKQGIKNVPVHDENGNVLLHVPTITQITEQGTLHDNSTMEVVDPRDFVLHESARALQPWEPGGAQYVFHRCWYSFEQLKSWERAGYVKNVDMLKDGGLTFEGDYKDRETELWNVNRTKDLIEVLEYWCYEDGKVWRTLVGNRQILLRDKEASPYWHGGYPFVICSSMPQLFSTKGMSDIELVCELQEMLWEVSNQSLDNLELINNFITLVGDDVDDPDAFEWYPGARWPGRPGQVEVMTPPYQLADVTMQREALIKGDMQNVTAAAPFAGGTETATVDQKTATGASIVMNAAQQRLTQKKWQAQKGLADEAWMRLKNCQQFITDTRLLHSVGPSGKMSFREVTPLDIQGEFLFVLDAVNESQNRQERRAEASTILQMMQQVYPMSYASGTPIDLHEVLLWVLRQWDLVDEGEAFFEPKQQPDPEMTNLLFGNAPKVNIRANTSPQAADTALGATGDAPNMGTTAGTAVDASSPSATGGMSMSPAMMMQRALAMRGGANNK